MAAGLNKRFMCIEDIVKVMSMKHRKQEVTIKESLINIKVESYKRKNTKFNKTLIFKILLHKKAPN